MLIDAAFRNGT